MITGKDIVFSYTGIPIFDRANFSVGRNMKVALVGPNGAGKSTLFSLISGQRELEGGTIAVEGTVSLVPQEVRHDSVLDHSSTVRAYIDLRGVYKDFELEKMLRGLELQSLSLSQSPRALSGGQRTRLALCRALLAQPDILLLDEPTNFLDTSGKRWVMQFLSIYAKTLVLVSHDIALLNHAIDKVLAINIHTKQIDDYTGNYEHYQKLKKQADELLKRKILNERKHIARMKKGLRKMDRYTSEKGVRQRTQLKKRILVLEQKLPEMPREAAAIRLHLPAPARVGEIPLHAVHISKSYGTKKVLEDISLTLYRFERMALLGPNGAGKSTLIKILVGLVKPDEGTVVQDALVKIGYYSQEFETFDQDKTIMETMYAHTTGGDRVIRPLLARFLFPGDKVFNNVRTLSGGEKTRLAIALLLLSDYNLLVLDEPTTYLDPLSQRIILEALKEYQGGILVVSHTQDFIRELSPARALLLPDQRVATWSAELLDRVASV